MQGEAAFASIPLKSLRTSDSNPRRHVDEAKLRELADSITAQGVLEPLLVRPLSGGKSQYEVIAGHRRFRAAKIAGLDHVPCISRELSDAEALEIQVIENLQREDVHPLDEALGYERLLRMDGYDVTSLATKVGRSASYVYQRLRLTGLIGAAQEAFLTDKLHAGHARELARLTTEQQLEALKEMGIVQDPQRHYFRDDELMNVVELRRWIEAQFHLDLHGAPFKKDDEQLVPDAGPCTTCPKRTGANPLLWDDVEKGDTCTDRQCFAHKLDAHVEQRKQELAAKHPELVQVSKSYSVTGEKAKQFKDDGVLTAHQYTEAKKGDAGAVPAVIVDDYKTASLGRLVYVKRDASRNAGVGGASQDPSVKADREKRRAARETAKRVLAEIVATATGKMPDRMLRELVLPAILDGMYVADKHEAFWLEVTGVPSDDRDSDELTATQVTRVLLAALLWQDAVGEYVFSLSDDLKLAADIFDVDVRSIEAAAKAETKTAAKAKVTSIAAGKKKAAKKARKS